MSFQKSGSRNSVSRIDRIERKDDLQLKGSLGNVVNNITTTGGTHNNYNTPFQMVNKKRRIIEIVATCGDYLNSYLSIAPIYKTSHPDHTTLEHKLITETHSFIQTNPSVGTIGGVRISIETLADNIAVLFRNTAGTNMAYSVSVYYH